MSPQFHKSQSSKCTSMYSDDVPYFYKFLLFYIRAVFFCVELTEKMWSVTEYFLKGKIDIDIILGNITGKNKLIGRKKDLHSFVQFKIKSRLTLLNFNNFANTIRIHQKNEVHLIASGSKDFSTFLQGFYYDHSELSSSVVFSAQIISL